MNNADHYTVIDGVTRFPPGQRCIQAGDLAVSTERPYCAPVIHCGVCFFGLFTKPGPILLRTIQISVYLLPTLEILKRIFFSRLSRVDNSKPPAALYFFNENFVGRNSSAEIELVISRHP